MGTERDVYIYNADFLDHCMSQYGQVVIYGIGDYGKAVIDYLIKTGKKEKIRGIVVTDLTGTAETYEDIKICEADSYFSDKGNRKCCVIEAVSLKFQKSITMLLEKYGVQTFYCFTRSGYEDILRGGVDTRLLAPYRGIDFLVVGFAKCGTTSLYRILKKLNSVYVPDGKETGFFSWFDKIENAEEKLIKGYFSSIKAGQKVGMVESSFFANAKEIVQYFGREVKLILMMRNPVDAAFSMFKMTNRGGYGNELFEDMYQKYGGYHEEMFEKYCENIVSDKAYLYHYDYWLQNFYEYFHKEQILVVLFEELIKFPQSEVDRILKFIGTEEKYACLEFPKENEGNFVMKNIDGYKLAQRKSKLQIFINRYAKIEFGNMVNKEVIDEFVDVCGAYEKADKLNGVNASSVMQEKLRKHFDKNVRNLEKMIDKDLSMIWF